MSPRNLDAHTIVAALADATITHAQARAQLRNLLRRPVDGALLDAAVAAWSDVRDFTDGDHCWRTYLGVDHVAGDGRAVALESAEIAYADTLSALVRDQGVGVAA